MVVLVNIYSWKKAIAVFICLMADESFTVESHGGVPDSV